MMSVPLRRCFSLVRFSPVLKKSTSVISPTLMQKLQYSQENLKTQEIVSDYSKLDDEMSKKVFEKVNEQIVKKSHGRLFAVVQIMSKQYKITTEDLVVVRDFWPPTIGDKIRLEKVLLVGSSDFTLIGCPLLPFDQVLVTATVVEKTLSHTIPRLFYTPRKNNTKLNFMKVELTYLRINSITLTGKVNELGDTDGLSNRIF